MIRRHYAHEKLGAALYALTTGEGDVRSRLLLAYHEFHSLKPGHLPPELREPWQEFNKQLTKFGPLRDSGGRVQVGAVENTLRRIRNSTGSQLAHTVHALYFALKLTENSRT